MWPLGKRTSFSMATRVANGTYRVKDSLLSLVFNRDLHLQQTSTDAFDFGLHLQPTPASDTLFLSVTTGLLSFVFLYLSIDLYFGIYM